MPRRHPEPVGAVTVPTFRDVDPVLPVGGIGDYFGVSKGLAAKWARESPDFPEPFARPGSGALYVTAEVIEWGKRHERKRAEGPREAGDPRPPSVSRKTTRKRARGEELAQAGATPSSTSAEPSTPDRIDVVVGDCSCGKRCMMRADAAEGVIVCPDCGNPVTNLASAVAVTRASDGSGGDGHPV